METSLWHQDHVNEHVLRHRKAWRWGRAVTRVLKRRGGRFSPVKSRFLEEFCTARCLALTFLCLKWAWFSPGLRHPDSGGVGAHGRQAMSPTASDLGSPYLCFSNFSHSRATITVFAPSTTTHTITRFVFYLNGLSFKNPNR